MSPLTLTSAPVLLLGVWLAAEIARLVVRRRAGGDGPAGTWTRIGVLATRPWAVWAVFNGFCRLNAERIFNDPLTFPLYAGPWSGAPVLSYLGGLMREPEFWFWSLAAAGLAVAVGALAAAVSRRGEPGPGRTAVTAGLLCLAAFSLWTAVACLPRGARSRGPKDPGSYLGVWHEAGSTFLYSMPHVKSPGAFLKDFAAVQPRLRRTIHAATHPPGAALSLYWIGRVAGADPARIRENGQKVRYALGLTAVAALNVAAVCLLAGGLFRSARIGLLTAALWAVAPAAVTYSVFAQDAVYALFFHLGLAGTWFAVTGRRSVLAGVGLGAVFYILTMLTFSWVIIAAVFAVFAVITGFRERWSRTDVLARGVLPLAVMTVLAAATILVYRLDYLAVYRYAHDYHRQWYRYTGAGQWLLALAGGQLEMVLMMGTVPASVCAGLLRRRRLRARLSPPVLFLAVTIAAYLLPIVFGPNPLKMETSRCWLWILVLPLAFAARKMASGPRPAAWFAGAVAASFASVYLMRLFINFGI